MVHLPPPNEPVKRHQDDDRPLALRAELSELADVVGPVPLVDMLLERAFQLHATDVHLDPVADGLRVRLRIDGQLHDVLHLAKEIEQNVLSRLKLLAEMNLTDRRHCQDGHISHTTVGGDRDIRVGTSPTIYGERLVLRLMPDHSEYTYLSQLGFDRDQLDLVRQQLQNPYGMIIVAGPVGAGKSTTLYGALNELNKPMVSLATIEDPVERRIDGINQIQVDTKYGFGFVDALRGVLRQDPNVLMVGEIRDSETAHIACRAGLTGVLVLTTLHASDAASAIDVLREYGVPPMFIADSVRCVISQRLVRKVCPFSREEYRPDESACQLLDIPVDEAEQVKLVRGLPTPENYHTGYAGRTGIFEVLCIDSQLRKAILQGRPQEEIAELAENNGMRSLKKSARQKAMDGITSVEEMHRAIL